MGVDEDEAGGGTEVVVAVVVAPVLVDELVLWQRRSATFGKAHRVLRESPGLPRIITGESASNSASDGRHYYHQNQRQR